MKNKIFWPLILLFAFVGCKKEKRSELGDLPTASFKVEYIDSNNLLLLSNSSGSPFLYSWAIADVGVFNKDSAMVNIVKKGVYQVILTVYNKNGSDTVSQWIEIFKNAKPPCTGPMEFMTDCTSRTWKLAQKPGALWVGPPDGSQTWWAIDMPGIVKRSCAFNDEWIFNSDGTVEYKTKGDIWGEAAMGLSPDGCFSESDLVGDAKAWGSGVHQFAFQGGGADPLTLKMIGKGAFIGLQKVANGAEVTTPQMGVDYKVLSQTKGATARTMEIEVNFGIGIWRFTLSSPE